MEQEKIKELMYEIATIQLYNGKCFQGRVLSVSGSFLYLNSWEDGRISIQLDDIKEIF